MMLLEVDPNLVRPGWTPLLVIVLLGIVLFFLGRSMLKQFGRIDVPADHPADPATGERCGVVGRPLRDRGRPHSDCPGAARADRRRRQRRSTRSALSRG